MNDGSMDNWIGCGWCACDLCKSIGGKKQKPIAKGCDNVFSVILAFILGANFGVFIMALMNIAKENDYE